MKIRLVSDLHNEFSVYNLPVMEDEHEQVLILSGDIGVGSASEREHTMVKFLEAMSYRFKQVFYILGNHEFYKMEMGKVIYSLYDEIEWMHNVCLINDSIFEFEGYIFVGGTLWTDLKEADPLVMMEAKRNMNDYFVIKYNKNGQYSRLYPEITVQKHYKTRDYIFHIASEHRDKKVVVMTHHAPSYRSIDPRYKNSNLDMVMNYNYFSDLDDKIMNNENIILWTHGHTHCNFDYNIDNCRVLCNPRGYSKHQDKSENPNFNPTMVIEI